MPTELEELAALPLEEKLHIGVHELALSIRVARALHYNGIKTVMDLIVRQESELRAMKNFGDVSLSEVRTTVEALGLHLGSKLAALGHAPQMLYARISRRDLFAAFALAGLCHCLQMDETGKACWNALSPYDCLIVAESAYRLADAMPVARKK